MSYHIIDLERFQEEYVLVIVTMPEQEGHSHLGTGHYYLLLPTTLHYY